ncbi:hypothetical protein N9U62_03570 [Candidatus Pelagibacter sp.]|nr:hypothetical protein [Candidatus Pelagibacter sp.]
MNNHIIFLLYSLLFIHSIIGYGFLFGRIVDKKLLNINLGYIGIIGFFFICLLSTISSFFIAHGYSHNITFHFIGLLSFLYFINFSKNLVEIKYLWILTFLLLIGLYIYKNHDDFPYYHLTYALNLSENGFLIGTGNFSHGFRTFSSLFYFHSILYMPYIDFYLFHSGPFFILIFFNYIILYKMLKFLKSNKLNLIFYFSLLSFIFINIAFYRIAEHGTDRSAQILLIIIFILFFDIVFFEKNSNNILTKSKLLLILIFLASSMKVIYYLYLILVPIIFFRKKLLMSFLNNKNLLIILILSSSLSLNIITNYLNTGCLLYPAEKTCIFKQQWSIPKAEVKKMSIHYEWWSKAGGGPEYKSKMTPEEYVKNFNWLNNWIERHFFNKVTDSLFGISFIALVVFISFRIFLKRKTKISFKKKDIVIYLIPLFFLIEWFLNHPSMRYGGYVLFAIPIFIFTAFQLQNYILPKKIPYVITISLIIFTLFTYNIRNISRLDKEITFYKYNLIESPFFFINKVNTEKIIDKNNYKIFSPENNNMCWASKTPCSYNRNIGIKNFLWMKMIYRNDK